MPPGCGLRAAATAAASGCCSLLGESAAAGRVGALPAEGVGSAAGRGVGMELTIANPRGEAVAMRDALDRHISENHGPFWEPSIQRLAKIAKVSHSSRQLAAMTVRKCARAKC